MATIIFDFDDTLFNTKKLKEDFSQKLMSLGVPEEVARQSYHDTKKSIGNYTPEEQIRILADIYTIKITKDFSEWFSSLQLSDYLFPESISTLQRLSADHTLVLVTKGEETFQNFKIKNSGIETYFTNIYIVPASKDAFLKNLSLEGPVYFINDKESENKAVKETFPDFIIMHSNEKLHQENKFYEFIINSI